MSATPRGKGSKSLVVVLHLSAALLAQFSQDNGHSPAPKESKTSSQSQGSGHNPSDSNATPSAPDAADASSNDPSKVNSQKKRGGAAPAGKKRAPPMIDPNGPMKERGRPGPKKKPRLTNGPTDRVPDGQTPVGKGVNAAAVHKLGPKANTGAINAGLRALDRSGKPCRKWERKGLSIKSFTGIAWGTSTWKAPLRDAGFSGDVKSDTTGSSDVKPNESSVVASDHSHGHIDGDTIMTNGVDTTMAASSPAPAGA